MFSIFILLLSLTESESSLRPIFSDEFNSGDSIDQNKWDVIHEDGICNGNGINQLNCNTNNKTNLRIIEGSLALAAIRQKYLNKDYTSSTITTKQSFTYGRFEMRASLPNGKFLRPVVYLIPTTYTGPWPKDGHIGIFSNTQTTKLDYEIHSTKGYQGTGSIDTKENLNKFQVYGLEWTQSEIKWLFNDKVMYSIDLTKSFDNEYNPFNKPFKLRISLGIGGSAGDHNFFPGDTWFESYAEEWNCSLLIFDYIRVYENVTNDTINQDTHKENQISSSEICEAIMPSIRAKKPQWKMIFSDEFNERESIDQDKWEVENEIQDCDGNNNAQLHCKTNSSRNVMLTQGTLVLAAIREKYWKRDYTAPSIKTRMNFTYGRFEIRAALPDAKMLRSSITLIPSEKHNIDSNAWARDGLIEIMSNTLLQEYYHAIFFVNKITDKVIRKGSKTDRSLISYADNLFNFHTYFMEWTEYEIQWGFDNKVIDKINIKKELADNYNPFDKPFQMIINLGVGGDFDEFHGQTLNEQDTYNWKCQLFILDYIRIYKNLDEDINVFKNTTPNNNLTSEQICQMVLPTIRNGSLTSPSNMNGPHNDPTSGKLIAIISVSSFLILLAIIPLVLFLLFRMKTFRKDLSEYGGHERKEEYDLYDGIDGADNQNYYNSYEDPYESCNLNEYVRSDSKETNENTYLKMTNKVIEKP